MTEIRSEAENIDNLAQCMMEAFRTKNIKEGEVLTYEELYPILQEKYPKYKDVQKEAEQHLTKLSYVNPAPDGLMLTQVGYDALSES